MRFQNLREAVALVNQTGYGLTSGLESLGHLGQIEVAAHRLLCKSKLM